MKKTITVCVMVTAILHSCSHQEKKETSHYEKPQEKPPVLVAEHKEESVCKHSPINDVVTDNPFNIHNKATEFTVDAGANHLLYGAGGTRVFIPAQCFETDAKHIKITLHEYLNEEDLFLSQLTTVSNNKPLISGGTVNIEAYGNGKKLKLKQGASINVIFRKPAGTQNDMMAFYGTRTSNGSMNWPRHTTAWKNEFYETGFFPASQHEQDSLHPEIKKLRDSIIAAMNLTEESCQWLYNETNRNRSPKFFIRKGKGNYYVMDKKAFTYNVHSAFIQKYALMFFKQLLRDSVLQSMTQSVSFSPAIERKPFYVDEKEWVNTLVKKLKGDTTDAAAYMAQFALTNYILRATEMGFINCDRFYNYSNTNQEVLVNLPPTFKGKVQMIIPAVNGVYEATKTNENTWSFSGLPKGLPFTLVAFTPVNGKISAYFDKGKTGNQVFENAAFKKYSCNDFVAMVKKR